MIVPDRADQPALRLDGRSHSRNAATLRGRRLPSSQTSIKQLSEHAPE
jgi:hypothetical protein